MRDFNVKTILNGALVTGAGASFNSLSSKKSFQATVTGTGTVTATVWIEVSNDGSNWLQLTGYSVTLTATTIDSDGISLDAPWAYVRANVTAITGTGATVTVVMAT